MGTEKLPKGFKEGKCKCGNSYGYCGADIGYCVKCLDAMEKPKCLICKKEMKNCIDSITKKVSPYLWETTCEHSKNMRLARG